MPKLKVILLVTIWLYMSAFCLSPAHGKSDPGKTSVLLNAGRNRAREQRPLLANSSIYVKIECDSKEPIDIIITWSMTETKCLTEDIMTQSNGLLLKKTEHSITSKCPNHLITLPTFELSAMVSSVVSTNVPVANNASAADVKTVGRRAVADDAAPQPVTPKTPNPPLTHPLRKLHPLTTQEKPIFIILNDGIYEFELRIETIKENVDFSALVSMETLGPHGYISAIDWPLLPFYCVMCVVYVVYGITWLVVSFMQWRDLLRIQFWIGGVILLGMLEKAFFYAQYNSLNHIGLEVQGPELVAEFVSCAKRTLARMLVIIMSLGFGIVKPRLGPMLHRVVGVGALYFVLASVESYLRVMRTRSDERNESLVARIPLAVLDTGICWWIFTSLVQTTRTLRLRRNMVKLSLYRHFTNTLIFSVLASVLFMLYALHLHTEENCTPGWKDIWVDTAFWHVLFSVLLLVIMILWRPTNNNQRYAFTPLLDNPEDEDDEEEEDQFVADAYGVKMRSHSNGTRTPPSSLRGGATTSAEDDLRWVEENIPSSMSDPALPILDSDEEIINTKFEVSKMQ